MLEEPAEVFLDEKEAPVTWVPVSRLLDLARLCLDVDTWDVCTCTVDDEDDLLASPVRVGPVCTACRVGGEWRQAFWSVLDQYGRDDPHVSDGPSTSAPEAIWPDSDA